MGIGCVLVHVLASPFNQLIAPSLSPRGRGPQAFNLQLIHTVLSPIEYDVADIEFKRAIVSLDVIGAVTRRSVVYGDFEPTLFV